MDIKKKIFLVFISLNFIASLITAQTNYTPIVPEPQKTKFNNKKFDSHGELIQLKFYCEQDSLINTALKDLVFTAKKYCESTLTSNSENDKIIHIGINNYNEEFHTLLNDYNVVPSEEVGLEGYELLINSDEIILFANSNVGIFYGLQSLKHLFRAASTTKTISGALISDWPSFKYRAISDDISRGPIPTLDYMKYQIRRLSEMKVNTIIHYVEHVVKTETYPEFAPEDGSLTIDEWKEIADFALNYNITVIGGFQSFGHFQKILETPEFANLGESGTLISPVNPVSYEFLGNIYDEMIPAFHSEIFNINCDETFDLGKEASKQLVDSIGYAEVYYQHIMKLYNIVKKHNKRIIMWGDIILKYPFLLDKLPKDILIGTWNYDDQETFVDFIDPFKNSGHEFWVVPGVLNSRRIYPDFDKAFKNINVFVTEGYEAGASGVLNCFWDDGSTGLFSNDWYGAAYGADKSWNVNSSDITFDNRYSNGSFASNDSLFFSAIRKINELRFYELTDGMTDKFMFANLLPAVGEENAVSIADLNKCATVVNDALSKLQKAKLNNYKEDAEYLQYIIELYKILIQERFDLLEASKLYSEAEKEMNTNVSQARSKIITSLGLVTKLISNQIYLKNHFEYLWLKENHTYALNWITDKFEKKINDFREVKSLLLESVKRIDSSEPILTIKNVRLAISELPGKYFTEWMMINPLPNKDNSPTSKIDYLSDMGGEKFANPKVTQEFYFDNKKYRWRRVVSDKQDIVDLNLIFNHNTNNGVTYAFATISTEEEKTVKASISFSSGIEVFINGESIYKGEENKIIIDQNTINLPLQKGKNNLLLKISKNSQDWAFTFRLLDSDVRNSKNRYRIIQLEKE
jgi:hexosaminidase